jgi:hypothetical protein
MDKSTLALGRLDGAAAVLPDFALFLYFYVRKEALLSSQIEGPNRRFPTFYCSRAVKFPGFLFMMSRKSPTMSPR